MSFPVPVTGLDYFYPLKKRSLAEDSLETSRLIFSEKKNREKIIMNVVCCSRDWCCKV